MAKIDNPHFRLVLNNILPRILTKLDRDKTSPTYGCFDRMYWHYRIRDFPSLIEQQPVLVLSLLYTWNHELNIYYKNEKIKEYIIAALNFWKKTIHSDGSGDEYWPNEHGYPPTVFPLYAVCESYKLIGIDDVNFQHTFKKAVMKSVNFISKWREDEAVNQEFASIAALYSAYTILKKKSILSVIDRKLNKIKNLQTNEGWFPEYGGADLGYLSVSLEYAALYYSLSKDRRILPLIEKMLEFIKYFVHPDGSFGGDYGSRNTEYFLPCGLELLAPLYPIAGKIADFFLKNINGQSYLNLSIDDRYLCDYFGKSFAGALVSYKPRKTKTILLPYETKFEKFFQESKLYIKSTGSVYIIIGLSKGGIIKVYNKEGILFSDCGYNLKNNSKILTTNWWNPYLSVQISKPNLSKYNLSKANLSKPNLSNPHFCVDGYFHKHYYQLSTPFKHILLRIASKILNRNLIPFIKKIMITSQSLSNVRFKRHIQLNDDSLILHDTIISPFMVRLMYSINRFSLRFVPSSRFFQLNDILAINKERTYSNFKSLEIKKEFNFAEKKEKIIFERKIR